MAAAQVPVRPRRLGVSDSRALCQRWVAANAGGEFIGLGPAGLTGALIVEVLDPRWPALAAGAPVASGAIEDTGAGAAGRPGCTARHGRRRCTRWTPGVWRLRGIVPRPWCGSQRMQGARAVALPVTFVAPAQMSRDVTAMALSVAFAVGWLVASPAPSTAACS